MSMLVVVVTSSAVLMAADSREFPSRRDTTQKLFLIGNRAVLGHGGIGVIPFDNPRGGPWNAAVEAEDVSKRVPDGDAKRQFDFIQSELLKSLNSGLASRSLKIGGDNPKLDIMFINRDSDGRVFFARQELKVVSTPLGNNRWRHHTEAGGVQIMIDGRRADRGVWWDVPPECPVGEREPTASTPATISAFINSVARQSGTCTQMIGGLIRLTT